MKCLCLSILLLVLPRVSTAAEYELRFEAPESAVVGAKIPLVLSVTNVGDSDEVIKEPMFDHRSFDFEVTYNGKKPSRYTKYHPNSRSPSTLSGVDIKKGETIEFRHDVQAIAVGRWTFKPIFHGSGQDIEGEARTVVVEPGEEAKRLLLRFETDRGVIIAAFWPDVAPATALHIAELADSGFYNGQIFHRTMPGFMIQGGCPQGNGTGNPGYSIEAEFNRRPHETGVLSMARNGDPYERMGKDPRPQFANSAGSQFFLCDGEASFLNRKYTGFGRVVHGTEVIHEIANAPVEAQPSGERSKPVKPVTMLKVSLVHDIPQKPGN